MQNYTGSTLNLLRYYFDVNNEYVGRKLKARPFFSPRRAHTPPHRAHTADRHLRARRGSRAFGHVAVTPLARAVVVVVVVLLGLGRQVIALPISHKSWERSGHTDGTPRPPKEDVNAPDLYLPLMAFATYVLLFGYTLGARGTFTPEVCLSPPPARAIDCRVIVA